MTNNLYIPLQDRAAIAVSGNDAASFLQGLITNDINKVDDQNVIYALMLTPQGKFLYDFFIAKYEDKFLLDCEADKLSQILKKFKMYKLRSDVALEDLSDIYEVVALVGDRVFEIIDKGEESDVRPFCKGIAYIDPRRPRIFARSFIEKENDYQSFKAYEFTEGGMDSLEQLRISSCIPSANIDIITEDSFPHDFAMDELNAIDYNKGCYVGQEVTARVHHRGKARKSLFVVEQSNINWPDIGADILLNEKKVGKLLSNAGNKALAILDKEIVENSNNTYKVDDIEVTLSK